MFNSPDHVQPRANHIAVLVAALAVLAGAVSTWLIVTGHYWLPFAFFGALIAYGAILQKWRWGIYGLLAYLPFAGIPTILFYPATWITLLAKDILFVVPAYLGFVMERAEKRGAGPVFFVGAPAGLLSALAVIVFLQMFNPDVINPMVALIGLKVWLFYVPLYFLGYHLVGSRAQLLKLLRLILFVGLIPVAVGILEAIFLYSGRAAFVYSFYGPAASAVTQGFAGFQVGTGASLIRIPSTFSFVTQYWMFVLAMFPVAYALWAESQANKRRGVLYPAILMSVVFAGLSSGARAAFLLAPAYYLLVIVIDRNLRQLWKLLVIIPIALMALVTLLDTTPSQLFTFVADITGLYASSDGGILGEMTRALGMPWLGSGTGMAAGPARYAFDSPDMTLNLLGIESFYVKTVAELGIPGLAIVVALLVQLLWAGVGAFLRIRDRVLRALGAAVVAFLFLQVVYLAKGTVLDIDPLNVYFWLFSGILMKLPKLDNPS